MKRSENINELAAGLAKAQKAFTAAERGHTAKVQTKDGGSYSFNYADLAAYLEICRGPLADNGLAIVQGPAVNGNIVSITTLLLHTSGQWIESEPLPLTMIANSKGEFTPQIVGSAITYARRYSLSSLIGMASESDDDGNAASGNQAETNTRQMPACPNCGNSDNVIKGREEFGGGWVCWNNPTRDKHGCGKKWQDSPAERQLRSAVKASEGNDPPAESPFVGLDDASKAEFRALVKDYDLLTWATGMLQSEFHAKSLESVPRDQQTMLRAELAKGVKWRGDLLASVRAMMKQGLTSEQRAFIAGSVLLGETTKKILADEEKALATPAAAG